MMGRDVFWVLYSHSRSHAALTVELMALDQDISTPLAAAGTLKHSNNVVLE